MTGISLGICQVSVNRKGVQGPKLLSCGQQTMFRLGRCHGRSEFSLDSKL